MKACCKLIIRLFDGYGQAFPKFSKKQCLYNIPKKVRDEVDFFDADKHESLLQIDTVGMVKHSQSSHNRKFAMPLQYPLKKLEIKLTFLCR